MAQILPGPGLVNAYTWVPNNGPLTLSFNNGRSIGSLYLSKLDVPVSCSATPTPENGNPFYIAVPPVGVSNPQVIPCPLGTITVTLSAAASGTYYAFAYTGNYRPSMEGASAQ